MAKKNTLGMSFAARDDKQRPSNTLGLIFRSVRDIPHASFGPVYQQVDPASHSLNGSSAPSSQ